MASREGGPDAGQGAGSRAYAFVSAFDRWHGEGAARPASMGSGGGHLGPTPRSPHVNDGEFGGSGPVDLEEQEAGRAAPSYVVQGRQVGRKAAAVDGGPVVDRGRRAWSEAERDRAMLWWIGRFRFVTARELSVRFGVSEQRVNARVRRFLHAGLVAEHRPHNNTSRVVFLT